MSPEIADRLDQFVSAGWEIKDHNQYSAWQRRLLSFLNAVGQEQNGRTVQALGGRYPEMEWKVYIDRQVSHLDGLAITLRALVQTEQIAAVTAIAAQQLTASPSSRVFLVHGHDVAAKESVARFMEKLSLSPVILHEQANEGKTIIEKFESHSNVSFAVVLLTPDDVGAAAGKTDALSPRARQNVVLELGYFTGKLGRKRVCALFKPGIEVPSDIHGVLFVELDGPGAWKTKLAQEMVGAGLQINLEGLLS
jgi:predicted nucleotide-binding protein